jgi:hypothetical protein
MKTTRCEQGASISAVGFSAFAASRPTEDARSLLPGRNTPAKILCDSRVPSKIATNLGKPLSCSSRREQDETEPSVPVGVGYPRRPCGSKQISCPRAPPSRGLPTDPSRTSLIYLEHEWISPIRTRSSTSRSATRERGQYARNGANMPNPKRSCQNTTYRWC